MTTALVLVPLLVVSGMAIDFGGNYWLGVKMQRAVDAAALAGVIWLPDLTKARTVALDTMTKNGFPQNASNTITVTQVASRRLKVTLTGPGKSYLAGKILNSNWQITRAGTAEYLQGIPMGSPIASLANDPESAATPPQLWLNQSGAGSTKNNGDQFTSGVCGTSNSGFSSGCTGSTNTELNDGGYSYITRVSAVGSGALRIQAFDPAFIYTGDNCETNSYSAAEETTLIGQYSGGSVADTRAAQRYDYANKAYCPGDQRINGLNNVTTTYIVRAPDATPSDITDNPAICAISFSPYSSGYFNLLDQTKANWNTPQGLENLPFWKIFRRWVDICTINAPVVGDYITQVTTTASQASPLFSTNASLTPALGAGSLEDRDPSIVSGGHNRYALRSGFGASVSGTGLAVFAGGRLPLYVNQNTSSATFYLAKVQPQYAGTTLSLTFFDIADTAGTATMTVQPPTDSNYSAFPTCDFVRDGSPPNSMTSSGCSVTGLTSANYDTRTVTLTLVVPSDYTCDSASSTGCWLKVRLDFSGAPADTTTWTASLLGDPVRLVE
jgi:hypothetical protein